ncbi:MAG: sodium:proton antiporter [Butyrivibrio sp.]|nr:sodium:proton antiporter [Butyrivibrio sp.]
MERFFNVFILICILIISVLTLLCLLRAVLGPKLADRIMAINMIGTMTIAIIMLLSIFLGESHILDVAMIYAVISFVAVIVLAQIYIGIYHEKKDTKEKTDPSQREAIDQDAYKEGMSL